MRLKYWPFFVDWGIIFGKDRATGGRGSHFGDAVIGVLNGGMRQERITPDNTPETVRAVTQNLSDDESDFMSACRGESATSPTKHKKTTPNKRARIEVQVEGQMVDMLKNFIEKSDARWDKIVEKLGIEDESATRKKVFDALEYVP